MPASRDRGDDRNGGLAAAGDHVEVAGVEVVVEVDHRHAERADRGGRQVEHPHAGVGAASPVGAVRARGGGVEDELDVARSAACASRPSTPSAVVGHAQPPRAGQAVGVGVDADHRADVSGPVAAQDLDHQVGADVAGTDDGHRPSPCA